MRILWHIFVDPQEQAPYVRRLGAYLAELAAPGVEFELIGLDPPDTKVHRIGELRTGAQVLANLIEAEPEGFDAVVVGHFQDPGLWEARSALEVPVLGLGESSMLYACQLGLRVGIVTISPAFVAWHEQQIHQYRLDERIVAVNAMETDVELFMEAFEQPSKYEEIKRQFEVRAAELAARGAEVVIPAGGLPALLFREERDFVVAGATVLNPTPVLVKLSEAAASLRQLNGLGTSRLSTFALAGPENRREFVEQLGGHAKRVEPQ